MKKVKKRRIKKSVVLVILILLLILVLGIFGYKNNADSKKKKEESTKKAQPVEVEKKPKEYKVSMIMVGDALIHYGLYADAKTSDGYDFKPMLTNMKPIISKYDLAYYNQETVLGGTELGLSSYPMFNSPYEVGDAFIDCGFNLVSLATNHTMDKGEAGIKNSVKYWEKQREKGVIATGQWTSQESRDKAHIYMKNGITYAFFSYTMWNNGLNTPYGKSYLSNEYSEEKAKEDIEKVRDKVDVVMVAMHWGTEYSMGVSAAQEKEAKYLSDLGVDIIIGAHPHVVEPVEYINNNKTFVIYSLGNFISDQNGNERLTGLMMEVTIKKIVNPDNTAKVTIESPKAQLVYTAANRGGGYNSNFKLYTYSQITSKQLPNYENYYKDLKAVVNDRYKDLEWGLSGE